MKRSNPMRLHFTLFLILSIVGIAQLSWWVIFQIGEGDRITKLQEEIWNQQTSLALSKMEAADLSSAEMNEWLSANFSDLRLAGDQENIEITREALDRLDKIARKRVRMFVSEGAFFSLLVLTGVWFFYWTLRKRVELENRTSAIIHAASSGMKAPIETLKQDIQNLSNSDIPLSEQKEMAGRLGSNIKKISDTCEHVSIIQMLGTSKRKIPLEVTDISAHTARIAESLKSSLQGTDTVLNLDIEPDLKAVSNPGYWSSIVQSLFRKAEDFSRIELSLSKKGIKAELYIKYDLKVKSEASSGDLTVAEVEANLEIVRELAEKIGVGIPALEADSDRGIIIRAEIPLFDEGGRGVLS